MKLRETSLNTRLNGNAQPIEKNADELLNELEAQGDNHVYTSLETPMRSDAFALSDKEKIDLLEDRFREVLHILGMDLNDDSLRGTPRRVAKMYVNEIFQGLNPAHKPVAKMFENKYRYGQMLVERDITVHSYCEHHLVPIMGKAHVAYVSSGNVIGLSKINRIVKYFSKRPQVQERLTEQIAAELKQVLQTQNVALVIDAEHMCVSTRGVEDCGSSTVTAHYSGCFQEEKYKTEFLHYLKK